jgi:hypothetical protein
MMALSTCSGPFESQNGFISDIPYNDFSQFVGINNIINISAGTWTTTRIGTANYVKRHSAAADTSILGIDITPFLRTATSKGFQLNSVNVIYSIGTAALVAHSGALDLVQYVDGSAITVASQTLTGSLTTAVTTNIAVKTLSIVEPDFTNNLNSKFVFELTVNAALTSAYDFYGLNLLFSRNDL